MNMYGLMTGIIAMLTTISAWLFRRRASRAEALAKEIYNVDQAVEIWRELAMDLKDQLKEISEKYEILITEIAEYRKENAELKKQISRLTTEIKKH